MSPGLAPNTARTAIEATSPLQLVIEPCATAGLVNPPSPADSTAIHLDYFECVNKRDLDRIRALFHDDYTYTGADGVEQRGLEAGLAQLQGFPRRVPRPDAD